MPALAWVLFGVAGLVVVALVAVVVMPLLAGGNDDGETIEVALPVYDGTLPISDAVTLGADPMVDVDRGSDWKSGGTYFYDNQGREQQFPYVHAECIGIAYTEPGQSAATGKSSDEVATRGSSQLLEQGSVIDVPTYGGGTVELLENDRGAGAGSKWTAGWTAGRVFTGSGAYVELAVVCTSERDLDEAVAAFQVTVTIVLDLA